MAPRTFASTGEGLAAGEGGGLALSPGWPDFSSDTRALLTPLLACASPAEFIALQQRVDMPRLVRVLDDWSAVRLGAQGPVREDAAPLLQRKRADFLVSVCERYGLAHAEVFALFVLHSAHDDEVDAVLRLLAGDKRLGQTLARMPTVRQELEARGLSLSHYPERAERAGDVLRGMGRAAQDALATSPVVEGARYAEMTARWAQLPPPYQRAAHEVERALSRQHFSAGRVALGGVDALTFGVPLGFYSLVAGTGQGLSSLAEGEYEQAARELTPALMLGALYATGKVAGGAQVGPRMHGLQEVARRLEASLGVEGLRELAEALRARREAGQWVAAGGVDAALALHEARGDVGRAQALLSKARRDATGGSAPRRGVEAGLVSLVDEAAGLTREVVEARLALAEVEAEGPRLSKSVALLEEQRPSLEAPPPEAKGNPRWAEYVAYYEKRLEELRRGDSAKAPLRWTPYSQMWAGFARGMVFERSMARLLQEDAKRPRPERRFLGDFERPRIETNVGVNKPGTGLRYADVLVIEEAESGGAPRRVETLSFKSRDFSGLAFETMESQMMRDAREALRNYGETLDIRRHSLRSLLREGTEALVPRVRLVYEGGELMPKEVNAFRRAAIETEKMVQGVEVSVQ